MWGVRGGEHAGVRGRRSGVHRELSILPFRVASPPRFGASPWRTLAVLDDPRFPLSAPPAPRAPGRGTSDSPA